MKNLLFALITLCLTGLVGCTTVPATGPEVPPERSANLVTTPGSVGGSSFLGDPIIESDGASESDDIEPPASSAYLLTTSGSVGGLFFLGDPEIGPDGEPNSDDTYDAEEIMETLAMIVTIPILSYAYGMAHSGYAGAPSH